MRVFRGIAYLVALFALTIWHGGKVIVAALFRVPYRRGGVYDNAAKVWARRLLEVAGIPVTTVGMEHIPPEPHVYMSNHQSWFDILALAAALPSSARFVSKIELARVPVLGPAMRRAGHIFIDRKNLQQAIGAFEDVASVIQGGMSAVLFPEGTRSLDGELRSFKKGPFVLAIASQVPVVPVFVAGTFTILPKGAILIRPHPVTLFFGAPIPTNGMTYDDREQLLHETEAAVHRLRIDATEANG